MILSRFTQIPQCRRLKTKCSSYYGGACNKQVYAFLLFSYLYFNTFLLSISKGIKIRVHLGPSASFHHIKLSTFRGGFATLSYSYGSCRHRPGIILALEPPISQILIVFISILRYISYVHEQRNKKSEFTCDRPLLLSHQDLNLLRWIYHPPLFLW